MRRLSLASALFAVAVLGAPAPSDAATVGFGCAVGADLETAIDAAPLVFVGTVIGDDPKQGLAFVSVEEIWAGDELPPEVSVMNLPSAIEAMPAIPVPDADAPGAEAPTAAPMLDGEFVDAPVVFEPLTAGGRFLFIPDHSGEPFTVTCMPPVPMSDEVEALRPDEVTSPGLASDAPEEPAFDVGRFALPAFILVAIAVSIAAFSVKGPARG